MSSWDGRGGRWQQGTNAPIASNPFAPAPPAQVGSCGSAAVPGGPVSEEALTGPMLGKGSELSRVYGLPHGTGHQGGINCMTMAEGKIYSGGRDNNLFAWRGEGPPGGGFQLVPDTPQPISLGQSVTSLFYEPASKWLFCGLWSGEIHAFCKEPVMQDQLTGHRRSVSSITVHSSVVVSGSNDGTVRLWTMNPQTGRFQCHGQPLSSPGGPVTSVRVLNDGLWVGANNGITCFDLGTLQPRGTIPSDHQVTGLVECQGYMLATFRNGDVKIYDASGTQAYHHPSRGEHTSNTAVEVMMHPMENKPVLLCGQQFGYVTAYDLPDFRPRGSWCCKNNSDVKAILDVKSEGMFVTGGFHGDITVWQWTGQGASAVRPAANPFAPTQASTNQVAQASSPFAMAPAPCIQPAPCAAPAAHFGVGMGAVAGGF